LTSSNLTDIWDKFLEDWKLPSKGEENMRIQDKDVQDEVD
jgi:hypothetical protein